MQRRTFIKLTGAGAVAAFTSSGGVVEQVWATPVAGGVLPPAAVPQFRTRLVVPDRMPRSGTGLIAGRRTDLYDIAIRQVVQQVLPPGLPATPVFAYGPLSTAAPGAPRTFRSPALTIESTHGRPVRIRWVNQLVDEAGQPRPHLLPVDPTLHWANPGGGTVGRDHRPHHTRTPGPYRGPVPTVTHVHGATNVGDESDGYPTSWFLPGGAPLPAGYAAQGSWYEFMAAKASALWGTTWRPGEAVARYPVNDRACANWYHDHTLGITRLNTYAGLLGMFVVRGGPGGDHDVLDTGPGPRARRRARLPGPHADEIDYRVERPLHEVPLIIADRSFHADGSLFYPDTRAFFDGAPGPYRPESDLAPIWNPEFFGNTITVNGSTWPSMDVDRRRYRWRLLNACGSRFLILDFSRIPGVQVHQIGNDGGFLHRPHDLVASAGGRLLLAPSERADVIVDFSDVGPGRYVLGNLGPDEPYGGGEPGRDFPVADPATTGRVLRLRVSRSRTVDLTTPGARLRLPAHQSPPPARKVRRLALVEEMSAVWDGPSAAMLGTVDGDPADGPAAVRPHPWSDPVTETVTPGVSEIWEVYNTTEDAHPVHVHESKFEVLDRQAVEVEEDGLIRVVPGAPRVPAEPGESGLKDTVITYPEQVTRILVRFTTPGQYVWHCHVAEHEDNEMMRPLRIGPRQPGEPTSSGHPG